MTILLAADLADGESVLTEGVLVFSLVVANFWLAGNLTGWVVARIAEKAPAVDTVMMRWVVPRVTTLELVRKSKARMNAVAAERREELRRQGRL